MGELCGRSSGNKSNSSFSGMLGSILRPLHEEVEAG